MTSLSIITFLGRPAFLKYDNQIYTVEIILTPAYRLTIYFLKSCNALILISIFLFKSILVLLLQYFPYKLLQFPIINSHRSIPSMQSSTLIRQHRPRQILRLPMSQPVQYPCHLHMIRIFPVEANIKDKLILLSNKPYLPFCSR